MKVPSCPCEACEKLQDERYRRVLSVEKQTNNNTKLLWIILGAVLIANALAGYVAV